MSSKNTPMRSRLNVQTPKRNLYTPNSKCTPVASASRRNADKTETNILNTAFSSKTALGTPGVARIKPKSTALNACYTPTSLYRNTRTGHTALRYSGTPASKTRKSIVKTPKSACSQQTNNKQQHEVADTEISNLTVVVRVRPLNTQECSRAAVTNVVRAHGRNALTVLAGVAADGSACMTHSFTYDHVFYSCNEKHATQEAVFAETARPLIDRAFEGYNACLFAYGQTGSGKSYSMMGIEALDDDALDGCAPHPEAGIIPRFCHELFRRIDAVKKHLQAEIEVSYFEIYNEKIHDLLSVAATQQQAGAEANNAQTRPALKVREHPIWGPYVVDLSVHPVDSYGALRNWLAVGNSQRATAATGMNDKSSRSHSIFNIVLNLTDIAPESSDSEGSGSGSGSYASAKGTASTDEPLPRQTRRSKISLVDLAGSERISANGNNCDRIREGVCINKSLLTLGKVIAALSDVKKATTTTLTNVSGSAGAGSAAGGFATSTSSSTFVPYRESVLTWLLRVSQFNNVIATFTILNNLFNYVIT